MLLSKHGLFNDLSDELRADLEKKVAGFGKSVRYKFDIANENPDPQKHGGALIYPNVYTLDPATFYINDPYEKRTGVSKSKRIGMIDGVDEKGNPNKFKKIRVDGKYKGVLKLEIEEIEEHKEFAMFLEMHPKLTAGKFSDKSKRQVVTRIDEQAAATLARTERSARKKAMDIAEHMSPKELIDFADAMLLDSTQEEGVLRNEIELIAETTPDLFNDLVSGETIKYQSLVKQALDKGIIEFNPDSYSYNYASNKQPIITLTPTGTKNEVEKLADWLQSKGKVEQEVFKKIKALVEGKPETVA